MNMLMNNLIEFAIEYHINKIKYIKIIIIFL